VYVVRTVENKDEYLLKILTKVPGTSVVYVRNRKKTKEIADFLNTNGISAEHFHAGLKNEIKDARQARWKSGETRVIVATNAFGMGIDKPDVRTVIHMDLPDSLEAYFQEAGRAGRDEKKAYATLLFNKTDITKLRKRVADSFPPKETVAQVYDAIGNYYELAVGSGLNATYVFDIGDFCGKFHFPVLVAYNSVKILQQAGYLELTDEQDSSSMVVFTVKKDQLYAYKSTPEQDKLIHILLRSYTGLFTDMAAINEETLATRLGWSHNQVYEQLIALSREHIIKFIPRKKTPFLTYTARREQLSRLFITPEAYDDRRKRYIQRVKSVLDYAKEENYCRSQILLNYFGENESQPCGKCDICLRNKENQLTEPEFQQIQSDIIRLLRDAATPLGTLLMKLPYKEQKILQVIRFLLDQHLISQNEQMKLQTNI
jgi:ATP-dependent DNA helicase RecQ